MRETDIEKKIKEYLKLNGYKVWKNLTEGSRTGGSGRKKSPNKGIPDLSALKDGITYYLEVKTPTGKVSEDQKKWHEEMYKHGAVVHVVTSVNDVREVFHC